MGLTDDAAKILGRSVNPGALIALTGDLNERLRVREMEEVYLTAPLPSVPLPSYFVHAISVQIDGRPLVSTQIDDLRPGSFAISGPDMLLAEGGDVLRLVYLARLPAFEDGRTSRAYSTYPSLFLYGLLYHHAVLSRDADGAAAWGQQYETALSLANQNNARSYQGQIAQRPRPGYCA